MPKDMMLNAVCIDKILFFYLHFGHIMRLFKFFLIGYSVIFLAHAAEAKIYKWKDDQGNWQYSDIQPHNIEEPKTLKTTSTKQTKPIKDSANETLAEQVNTETLLVEQENTALKQKNCQGAKSNLATYAIGGRIRRVDKKGQLSYLNEQQITAAKKQARAQIEKYCQ